MTAREKIEAARQRVRTQGPPTRYAAVPAEVADQLVEAEQALCERLGLEYGEDLIVSTYVERSRTGLPADPDKVPAMVADWVAHQNEIGAAAATLTGMAGEYTVRFSNVETGLQAYSIVANLYAGDRQIRELADL